MRQHSGEHRSGGDTARHGATIGATVAAGAASWALAPPRGLAAVIVRGLHTDDGGVALLTGVLGAGLWLLLGWLTLAIGAAYAARLPGTVGRGAQAISQRITPALLRRLISGGAALGLGLAPLLAANVASAAPTRIGVLRACPPGAVLGAMPSLDRPTTGCGTLPPPAGPAPSTRSAGTTETGPTNPATTSISRSASESAPDRTVTAHFAHLSQQSPVRAAETHTVGPGDTLWGLAAAELGSDGQTPTPAQVSERWPLWWAANRQVIGASAALLHPGEVLTAPPTP